LLDARFDRYSACRLGSDLVRRTLPGVPRHSLFAELSGNRLAATLLPHFEAQRPEPAVRQPMTKQAEAFGLRGIQLARGVYTHSVGNWEEPFARIGQPG